MIENTYADLGQCQSNLDFTDGSPSIYLIILISVSRIQLKKIRIPTFCIIRRVLYNDADSVELHSQ